MKKKCADLDLDCHAAAGYQGKAEELIPLWASWGVDGLKIDFFENDSQHTMWQYNMLADLMIQYKLMINFHGSVSPWVRGGPGRTS